jgi:hypothetical protein
MGSGMARAALTGLGFGLATLSISMLVGWLYLLTIGIL